jgi:chemosensory pili system protein ChpC
VSQAYQVVPSIVIPVHDHPLVLPCAVVAEVVRYVPPEPAPEAPPWLLGYVKWRDRSIPVVSFEAARGDRPALDEMPSNLVVLNVLRPEPEAHFYAILTAKTPRLLQISDRTIADQEGAPPGALVSREVLVKGDPARIPDLAALESLVLGHAVAAQSL